MSGAARRAAAGRGAVRRAAAALTAATLVLAGCGGDEIASFGPGAPDDDAPELPADAGVDVTQVEVDGDVPPREVTYLESTWPQVAGWIAREADEGRPVVLNFFASFCEPCKRELPLLIETAGREDGVTFVGIHTGEQAALGAEMVEEYGIDYPTFHDTEFDEIAYQTGGRVLPYTVAFDTDGRMVSRVFGELTATSLDQLLDAVR